MDRNILEQHLAMAERHVAEGEGHIARQRELISKLFHKGDHDMIPGAQQFLALLEDMQTLHVADRDRLRAQLRES